MVVSDMFDKQIGKGAYSTVWTIKDNFDDFIIENYEEKVIKYNYKDQHILGVRNLLELDILKKVQGHPFCVQLKDILYTRADDEGLLQPSEKHERIDNIHFGLEFAPMSLNQCARDPDMTFEEKRVMFYQLVIAVDFIHQLDILHGDIKPSNVLYHPDSSIGPKVCLADFGISYMFHKNDPPKGKVYTCIYRPPEVEFEKSYDKKADIYALCATGYQLFTGIFPVRYNDKKTMPEIYADSYPQTYSNPEVLEYYKNCDKFIHPRETLERGVCDMGYLSCQSLSRLIKEGMNPLPNRRPTTRDIINNSNFSDLHRTYQSEIDFIPLFESQTRNLVIDIDSDDRKYIIKYLNYILFKREIFRLRTLFHFFSLFIQCWSMMMNDEETESDSDSKTMVFVICLSFAAKILSRFDDPDFRKDTLESDKYFENGENEELLINYLEAMIYEITPYEIMLDIKPDLSEGQLWAALVEWISTEKYFSTIEDLSNYLIKHVESVTDPEIPKHKVIT